MVKVFDIIASGIDIIVFIRAFVLVTAFLIALSLVLSGIIIHGYDRILRFFTRGKWPL